MFVAKPLKISSVGPNRMTAAININAKKILNSLKRLTPLSSPATTEAKAHRVMRVINTVWIIVLLAIPNR